LQKILYEYETHFYIFTFFFISAIPFITFCGDFPADSCRQFAKGKFIVEGKEHIKIVRKKHRQIEYNSQDRIKTKYRISWTGPCPYTLVMMRTTNKDKRTRDQKGAPMPHIIISTTIDSCTYKTEYSFWKRDRCGTLRGDVKKKRRR
jgi:hypothetical protein